MKKHHLITAILLALFFGVALYLRIALPYDKIFVGDWIKFAGTDAYYHMRIIDNLVHNFPRLSSFDPYMIYPGGSDITGPLFFNYLIAGIIWLIGLGSPSQHTVDIIGVYIPAVLGAITIIPVYYIGKALFNRWAGIIAAGLLAISPGEFLGRSTLGATDYHVAEVLFTTTAMLFLILAVNSARQTGLTFAHLKCRDWPVITKPLIYSLLAGIFLGIYFLTWQGALLFTFIIFVFLVLQFIIDHFRKRSTTYLCFISAITFIVALLLFLPTSPDKLTSASLAIAIVVPVALAVLSYLLASRGIKPVFYPVSLLGIGLVSLAILNAIDSSLIRAIWNSLSIFIPPMETTVSEMRPILFPEGNFSLIAVWLNFTTGFFLAIISLGILIYFIIRRGEADKTLLVFWSLVILAATISMRRFAYYLAPNIALLAGYFSWLALYFFGFKESVPKSPEVVKKGKKPKKPQKVSFRITARRAYMTLGIIIVFFLSFFPNITPAMDTAGSVHFAPGNAWYEALTWLKDNTPEPFADPQFYYAPHKRPFTYPRTAYGVTAWWDYGYWITRIGHRIPTSNPGTGLKAEISLFTAQDEASANKILETLSSKYVIVDYDITSVVLKFHAIASASGSNLRDFGDVYYQLRDGKFRPSILFYPEYYRLFLVRLYNFDASQVIPLRTMVISYQEKFSREIGYYKEITSTESFSNYRDAEAFIKKQQSGNYRIVGTDPFTSPVPLEALKHYRLIYSSKSSLTEASVGRISEVKVFEYVKE